MNKQTQLEAAISKIPNGASIMIGGFGSPGTPFTLIEELLRQGQKNLTLIKNDANETGIGISHLIENGQVDKLITTHIGLNRKAVELMNQGRLDVAFYPQGILAEKIRVAGAGSFGFLSDIGLDTEITSPESLVEWQGTVYKLETALNSDFALIHANRADSLGNLQYKASAMNFCPLMAMAAEQTIVEVRTIDVPGSIEPEAVHTSAAFIDDLVLIEQLGKPYQLMEHHL